MDPAPRAPETREGESLSGKYQLEELLGKGGMGEVYRARNLRIGRTVAIKLLRRKHAENDKVRARFMREAQAANLVQHPHVVQVLDVDTDGEGVPYIVQEFLEGETLANLLKKLGRPMPIGIALGLLVPVSHAVAAAHDRGVVHRDLKPDNVFLARVGDIIVPKVVDFGISKVVLPEAEDVRLTATHVIMGSPAYMSPEQIVNPQKVDGRADVWAFGVMLYEVLSGRLPFSAKTPNGLFVRICTADPTPLRTYVPEVPDALADVVQRCLRRDPRRRYPDGEALAKVLSRLSDELGLTSAVAEVAMSEPDPHGVMTPSKISGIEEGALADLPAEFEALVRSGRVLPESAPPLPRETREHGVFRVPEELRRQRMRDLVEGDIEAVDDGGSPTPARPPRGPALSSQVRSEIEPDEDSEVPDVKLATIPPPRRGTTTTETAVPRFSDRGDIARALAVAMLAGVVAAFAPLFASGDVSPFTDLVGAGSGAPFVLLSVLTACAAVTLIGLSLRSQAYALLVGAVGLLGFAVLLLVARPPDPEGSARALGPVACAVVTVGFSVQGLVTAYRAFRGEPPRPVYGYVLLGLSVLGLAVAVGVVRTFVAG